MLHDLTNILSVLKSSNQQGIRSFYDYQIAHTHCRDKLARCVHIVAMGIQDEEARTINQVALRWIALRVMMLVQRGPGPQVVPSEIRRQAKDVSRLLAFRRTRLQHGVIDADVLALGIQPAKGGGKLPRAESGGNLFQQRSSLRKMLAQGVGQSAGAP